MRQSTRTRVDPDYPCTDPPYSSAEAAHLGIAERVASDDRRPAEQPYTYQCVDGHWHARLVMQRDS